MKEEQYAEQATNVYADGGRGAAADHRQLPGLDGLSHHRRKAVQIPLRRAGHDPRPASGRHRLRGVRLLERKDGPVCPQGLQGHRPHRQQRRKAEASVCVRRVGYGRQKISKEPLPVGIPGGTRGCGKRHAGEPLRCGRKRRAP